MVVESVSDLHDNANANKLLLPLANEVWGEVMFLHLPVCSQRAGGRIYLQGVCLEGGLHPGGVCLWGSASRRVGQKPLQN